MPHVRLAHHRPCAHLHNSRCCYRVLTPFRVLTNKFSIGFQLDAAPVVCPMHLKILKLNKFCTGGAGMWERKIRQEISIVCWPNQIEWIRRILSFET